jgi:CRP-like cAMP-binding protein
MISPEQLRRYPFFGRFNDAQQKTIAMLAEEITVGSGTILFNIEEPADFLFLLVEGGVDLYDVSVDEHDPKLRKEFLVGEVDAGDLLAISALVDPYRLTATAKVTSPSRFFKFDAQKLRQLCTSDVQFGYTMMHQIAKLTLERLTTTRVLLAAERG